MIKKSITLRELQTDLTYILNKKISHSWKGFGSALFLEIGDLHKELAWGKDGKLIPSLTGEWSLSSDGAWKLEKNGQILIDAEKTTPEELKKVIQSFTGLTIQTIEASKQQLTIRLSNGHSLLFLNTTYGFFTLLSNEKPYISTENNTFVQHASL